MKISPEITSDILGMIFPDEDVGLGEQLLGKVVDVTFGIDHFLDPRIDEDLGAHRTWICGGIDGAVLDAHTEICRLDDSILFRMDSSAELMSGPRWDLHLFPDASEDLAVLGAFGRSVISSGEDALVLDDDRTHLPPETCGSLRNQECHFHEVLVIVRSVHEREIYEQNNNPFTH